MVGLEGLQNILLPKLAGFARTPLLMESHYETEAEPLSCHETSLFGNNFPLSLPFQQAYFFGTENLFCPKSFVFIIQKLLENQENNPLRLILVKLDLKSLY